MTRSVAAAWKRLAERWSRIQNVSASPTERVGATSAVGDGSCIPRRRRARSTGSRPGSGAARSRSARSTGASRSSANEVVARRSAAKTMQIAARHAILQQIVRLRAKLRYYALYYRGQAGLDLFG